MTERGNDDAHPAGGAEHDDSGTGVPGDADAHRPAAEARAAEEAFVQGLIARGEAVPADDGELPAGATHELVEGDEPNRGVRRRRFSAH